MFVVYIGLLVVLLTCVFALADFCLTSRHKVPMNTCTNCRGRGRVPNHRLQVFEDCSSCSPVEEPAKGPRPGSRSRTSGLAERVA